MDHADQDFNRTTASETGTFESNDQNVRTQAQASPAPAALGSKVGGYATQITEALAETDRHSLLLFAGGALGAAAITGALLVPLVMARRTSQSTPAPAVEVRATVADASPGVASTTTADNTAAEPEGNTAVAPLHILSSSDLSQHLGSLTFDGQDVSLVTGDDAALSISRGHLLVSHTIVDSADISPWTLADFEAQRAAALANVLAGAYASGEGDETSYQVKDVTWVACNEEGEALLAITFGAGGAPASGETAQLLSAARGYAISDGFFYALGRDTAGYPQRGGQAPTNVEGEEIELTAYLPRYGKGE